MHKLVAFPLSKIFDPLVFSEKPGICPPLLKSTVEQRIDNCWKDYDCSGDRKCCQTVLGNGCLFPLPEPSIGETKIGICPKFAGFYKTYRINKCTNDRNCIDMHKCCDTAFGKRCLLPQLQSVKVENVQSTGICPPMISRKLPHAFDRCQDDLQCGKERKCCDTVNGKMCLLAENTNNLNIERAGICPDYSPGTGMLVYRCLYDTDCPDLHKCCNTQEGKDCILPSKAMDNMKPGACPLYIPKQQNFDLQKCTADSDCPGTSKCCNNKEGKVCLIAEMECNTKMMYLFHTEKPGNCPAFYGPHDDVDVLHKCNDDYDCAEMSKCCETNKGRTCIIPVELSDDNEMKNEFFCPDGEKTAILCANQSVCPADYSCFRNFCCKTHQKKPYKDLSERPGLCPTMINTASTAQDFECYLDSHCSAGKKCCDTPSGKSCLIPKI
ncbi:WAP four-disulfide core domain protein 3 [Trichinella murrelli]|uniref:WAP four-disulfide core domain protein 3 n=1 Tax=Trichinella murrelli TaxID=144512 RepID=A0A0V0TY65_9BILA|nr:WAP four-disulfide core domain protein 3 [Trichinella murrelli]